VNKKRFLPFGLLFAATILSLFVLSSSGTFADEEQADATVTVSSACTMFRESTVPHVVSGSAGSYHENVGITRLNTVCNDKDGYAIYAVGYSHDTVGDTNMYGEESGAIIPTGTASGNVSNWSMKLAKDLESYNPQNLTITSGYDNYHNIPAAQTKVASFVGATDTTKGSVITSTYAIRVSSTQVADTYTGFVKYTMVHPGGGPVPDVPSLEDLLPGSCPTTPTNFYDPRDDEVYTIQKLADGNCWFLDNLRLDGANLNTALSSENTNMPEGASFNMPSSSNTGFTIWSTPLINSVSKNVEQSYGSGNGKTGVYYNMCAASLGTICSQSSSIDASMDVCPAGWRLPTSNEFDTLISSYDDVASLKNAFRVGPYGRYYDSSAFEQGEGGRGRFWSSTHSSMNSYAMYVMSVALDSATAFLADDAYYMGVNVRCVKAMPVEPEKTYIQDVTAETCPAERTLVYDKRDEKPYYIQQITAGELTTCWMTSNLNLDGGTVLTPELSNLYSTYTLPSSSTNGFNNDSVANVYNSNNDQCSENNPCFSYYNYAAATAETNTGSDASSFDICPKGWRLPAQNEFNALISTYPNGTDLVNSSWQGIYTGSFYNSSFGGVGSNESYGYYWSSSPGKYLVVPSPYSNMVNSGSKMYGVAIRCVAKSESSVPQTLQSYDSGNCPATPTVVVDERDGEKYTIQKLADGNCWMLDNLRLDLVNTSIDSLKGKTNASDVTLAFLKNGGGTDVDRYATSSVSNWSSVNSYSDPYVYTGYSADTLSYGDGYTRMGVYYNYCAASAGSYCYGDGTSQGTAIGSATEDICPRGWRLPTGGDKGEYRSLYNAYNGDYSTIRNALHMPLSGVYSTAGIEYRDSLGLAWASTYYDQYNMRLLRVDTSAVSSLGYAGRRFGYSVRCIAKDSVDLYMQDIDTWKDSLAINESVKAKDKRDGKAYWVTKLLTDPDIPDDRADCIENEEERVCTQIWMTQNLDFDMWANTTYTHEDTDLGWSDGEATTVLTPTYTTAVNYNTSMMFGYDPGNVYIYNSGTTDGDTTYNSLTDCTNAGHSVSDCEHYHVGNVYSFEAATASYATLDGNPIVVEEEQYKTMPNSICPAGWRLPEGPSSARGHSDFDYLFYGNNVSLELAGISANPGYTTDGFNAVRTEPLWFTRVNTINSYGSISMLWTSTYAQSQQRYAMLFGQYYVVPNNYTNGYLPVRCIARAGSPVIEEPKNVPTYMQEVDYDTCPTTPTTLYDSRDGEAYTIQKLADGKCWMLDNLRLDVVNTGLETLKGQTNASDNTLEYFKGVRNGTTSDQYATAAVETWTDSTDWSFSVPKMNALDKDMVSIYGFPGKIGMRYSFCAATAGSSCHGDDNTTDYGNPTGNATEDICPRGWRLPTGNDTGDYSVLFNAYGGSASEFIGALHAPYYNSDKVYEQVFEAWTSTPSDGGTAHYLLYYRDYDKTGPRIFVTGSGRLRYSTIPIRCVKDLTDATAPRTMQEITPDTCPAMPTIVYDNRDNQAYTIQRLADGKCWMLDNLRLGRNTVKTLTPDDTNIKENFILPGGVNVGFDEYTVPQINVDYKNDTTSYGDSENKVGVYYNYCAATAGTYCQGQGESSGTPTSDICPKGWRLPTGGEDGEYQYLYSQYKSYADFKNALRASLSGYFKYDKNNHQGSYGSFWSSTPVGDDRMYSLDVRSTSVPDDFSSYRTAGISIRCVAYEPTETLIQDITPDNCPVNPTIVYDVRDNSAYTIQKLADGNCWMLDNLRLGRNTIKVLTPADTNITKNYILPGSVDTGFNSYKNPQINIDSKNKLTSYGEGSNKVGVYYNYCAATAGTYCMPRYDAEGSPIEDICPKGWRLPTGGDDGEYQNLFSQYASYSDFKNALHASLSGYFKYDKNNHQGLYGSFWSSTPVGDDRMYSLDVRLASVPNDFSSYRTAGISIRCVAYKSTVPHYIQDVTVSNCPTSPTAVYDSRDEEAYTIQKINGDCWMLDNLRLDLVNVPLDTLKGSTNASDVTLEYLKGIRQRSDDRMATSGVLEAGGNSYSVPIIYSAEKDTIPEYGYQAKVGVYYNYCAASAGSYCYGNGADNSGYATLDAYEDICPAGWRLAQSGSKGEYAALANLKAAGGSYEIFTNTMRLPLAGFYYNNAIAGDGIYGYYWSSTSDTNESSWNYSNGMRLLLAYSPYNLPVASSISPNNSRSRNMGMPIRCIAKNGNDPVHPSVDYLQDITPYMCTYSPRVVYDKRDGEEYTIQRLADGKCWMLDNLRLGGEKEIALSPYDSHVLWEWTLPASVGTSSFGNYTSNYFEPRVSVEYKDTTLSYGEGEGKVGGYYNYCAASSGRVCNPYGSTLTNYALSSRHDICPKKWRLPTGLSSGEWAKLYQSYNSNRYNFVNSLHLTMSGSTDGYRGTNGSYFASDVSGDYVKSLYFTSSSVNTNGTDVRYVGRTIRCLMQ